MSKKKVVILGSTSSIKLNALKVIDLYQDHFEVLALTANDNWRLLAQQIRKFSPKFAAVNSSCVPDLKNALVGLKTKVLSTQHELPFLAALPAADIIVIAMSGSAALEPFLSAVHAGKQIAPANKEALVIAGEIIMAAARKSGSRIIPVDSEQSAIFQCLDGRDNQAIQKIYLTASGGALRNVAAAKFDSLTIADILNHPRWKMGKKITIDSATMMNKGFEVIEAQRLFGVGIDKIEVLIHPEAILHSMVSFQDGSVIGQLGVTDMRLPIQYALTYPQRWDSKLPVLDLVKLGQLNFAKPDLKKFPCLGLALHVAAAGGTLPTVLNAADEEAVEAFLAGKLKFTQIFKVVEKVVLSHKIKKDPSLSLIHETDQWARERTREHLRNKI